MTTSSTHPNVVITTGDEPVPGDYALLYPWFNLIRACRSVANTGSRAIVSVNVLVDELGRPTHNSKPRVTRLEPKQDGGALNALLDTLIT